MAEGRHHPFHRLLAVGELQCLGEIAVCLDRIAEAARGLVPPAVDGLRLGEAVEAVVDFHRVEMVGVEGEPALHRQFFRVEGAAPVAVVPS